MATLLLLLAFQTERVTFDFKDVKVERIIQVIETYAGAKIEVASQLRGRNVTIQAKNVPYPDAIATIAKQLGGTSKRTGKDRFRIAPAWQHAIYEKLESKKVHGMLMEEVALGQALRLFRAQCDVRVHCTADRAKKIKFTADDVTYRTLLDVMAKAADAEWQLRYGVVYFAPRGTLAKLPLLPPKIGKAPQVVLHLENKSIADALRYLQAVSGRRMSWPKELPADKVNVRADSVTLDQALALILYPVGLEAEESGSEIKIANK